MQAQQKNPLNKTFFSIQTNQKDGLNDKNECNFLSEFSVDRLNNLLKLNNQKNIKTNQNLIIQKIDNRLLQYPQKQCRQIINANSIVKSYQLVLICCLIMASVASVTISTNGTLFHVKKLTNYFNLQILGNDNTWLYQDGDNIDQARLELTIFEDMIGHFDTLIQVLQQFDQEQGFPDFTYKLQKNILIEHVYRNQTLQKKDFSLQQFKSFIKKKDLRVFILTLQSFVIKINFGENKRVKDFNLTLKYKTYSSEMLRVDLKVDYNANMEFQVNQSDVSIRIIQQILAFILTATYLNTISRIRQQNDKLKGMNVFEQSIEKLQTNRIYWCYSLIFMNIVTVFSETYAPMCSFLQILPVFEQTDSTDANKYNFNTNLRYSIPIILRIFIPAATLLNGFIFYSLIMYPGQYFDDYSMGLFSYLYQNFQVGTYEIFMQLQDRGNFAYFLYGILYFYMVLVANNLLPALFCTMIYIKINQKQLKNIIRRTLNNAICPKCQHINLVNKAQQQNFQINIISPTFSPYLKGKLQNKFNHKSQKQIKTTKIYVENKQKSNGQVFMNKKLERFKLLSSNLKSLLFKEKIPINQQNQFSNQLQQFLTLFNCQFKPFKSQKDQQK